SQLILSAAGISEVTIELGCFETQNEAGERRVAVQTLTSAWIMPHLCPDQSAVVNNKGLIQSFCRNQRRIGQGVTPAISDAVNTRGVADEEASFQPPGRSRDTVGQLQLKVLYPERADRKGPVPVATKADRICNFRGTENQRVLIAPSDQNGTLRS